MRLFSVLRCDQHFEYSAVCTAPLTSLEHSHTQWISKTFGKAIDSRSEIKWAGNENNEYSRGHKKTNNLVIKWIKWNALWHTKKNKHVMLSNDVMRLHFPNFFSIILNTQTVYMRTSIFFVCNFLNVRHIESGAGFIHIHHREQQV